MEQLPATKMLCKFFFFCYFSSTKRFCLNEHIVFRSSLSNSIVSDLFCVYTDNYPGRREFSSVNTISSLSEAEDRMIEFGNTASLISDVPSFEPFESVYYRSGDPIEIIFGNDASGFLPLPAPLNGGFCHDGNPITYLNDQSITCTQSLSSNGEECAVSSLLNAEVFSKNFTVLTAPFADNVTSVSVEMTCRDLIGQEVSCDSPVFNSSSSLCSNALLSLSYIIVHNATEGLVSVSADVTIGVVPIGTFTQSFTVQFLYSDVNETGSSHLVRPGNPGYVQGQPILAGVLMGDSVNVSADNNDWLTVAIGDSRGRCLGQRESVIFRNNHRSSCILKLVDNRIIVVSG